MIDLYKLLYTKHIFVHSATQKLIMNISDAIDQLKAYKGPLELTLHKGANEELISKAEKTYGFTLPGDFKTLYRFTNGFETVEDIFNMIPLDEIIENRSRHHQLWIAEYMIYCDMWELEVNAENPDEYSISVLDGYGNKIILTNSLGHFINRFLKGGIFEIGGLYAWADEIRAKLYGNSDPKEMKPLLWVYREGLKRGLFTKKNVIDYADWIIATEENPHHFFIELSLSHDVNGLIEVLDSMFLTEDILQLRAFFYVIYTKISTNQITTEQIIAILDQYWRDERFTMFERNKISEFVVEWDYLHDGAPDEQLVKQLHQDIKEFFRNYMSFNLYHYKTWERTSVELVAKFELLNK